MDHSIIPADKVGPQTAATFGVLLALLLQTHLGWRRAVSIVFAGEIAAYFLTGVAAQFMGTTNPNVLGAIGLGFGLGGVYIAGAFVKVMEDFQNSPLSWLRRVISAIMGAPKP